MGRVLNVYAGATQESRRLQSCFSHDEARVRFRLPFLERMHPPLPLVTLAFIHQRYFMCGPCAEIGQLVILRNGMGSGLLDRRYHQGSRLLGYGGLIQRSVHRTAVIAVLASGARATSSLIRRSSPQPLRRQPGDRSPILGQEPLCHEHWASAGPLTSR